MNILNESEKINYFNADAAISDLIERIMMCLDFECVYCIGDDARLKDVCNTIPVICVKGFDDIKHKALFYVTNIIGKDIDKIKKMVVSGSVFVIYATNKGEIPCSDLSIIYDLNGINGKGIIALYGKCFKYNLSSNKDFKVLAIMHIYNEEDILEHTVRYLLAQNIDVYILDNESTDRSYEIAERLKNDYPSHVFLERFVTNEINSEGRLVHAFRLYDQMEKTELISKDLNYDWYIHYDVDEIRVAPWHDVSLKDSIEYIDSLGFNCIECSLIDFRITDKEERIFDINGYYEIRYYAQSMHRKCWKKTDDIDLKNSGGHYATFDNIRLFPLKFLIKHYPFRSLEQAKRKVLLERKNDFVSEKKKRNWHSHYDTYENEDDFIFKKDNLLYWEKSSFDRLWLPLFTGCGLKIKEKNQWRLPNIVGKNLVIYGAGKMGMYAIRQMSINNIIISVVDSNYKRVSKVLNIEVEPPDVLREKEFDYIVIAITQSQTCMEVKNALIEKGISEKKLIIIE